ncbi:MAG: hypothetical protein OJF49_003853 [Ktedonobacterales bacterium]|jgi:rSAM/selenodomain-associated transferase 1|nr:MAG: hypothetical protein OJF49_003853 [Ktedonobacterales bacterium]
MNVAIERDIPSIAIVMPALNEEAAVGAQVRALRTHSALAALPIRRIIVVDNGSDDATAEVARAAGAEVVYEPRRGYGYACLAGVRAAEDCEIVLLMDADGSDDPAGAARVAAMVARGEADLAMGSRARGKSEHGALTLQQRVGNRIGALALRLLYGARVSDIGPVRAIRREALLRLEMREMAYGWSTEMLAKAARAGLRIVEAPVDYHRRAGGKSKVAGTLSGTMKASIHILRTLWRYRGWRPAQTSTGRPYDSEGERRDALFIVARLPVAGQTKTRLGRALGYEAAAALYAAFLRDLGERFSDAAMRNGYDLYWNYAAPDEYGDAEFAVCVPAGGRLMRQPAGDFAERLWHGFTELAARGYERIVVLGSDSPHMPADWVRAAFTALDTHDVALGPAHDGGYYLLGQRRARHTASHAAQWPADLFTGIQMSTATVYTETLARVEALGLRVMTLPTSFDVDEIEDLETLAAALRYAPSDVADPAPATLAALEAVVLAAAGEGGAHGRA